MYSRLLDASVHYIIRMRSSIVFGSRMSALAVPRTLVPIFSNSSLDHTCYFYPAHIGHLAVDFYSHPPHRVSVYCRPPLHNYPVGFLSLFACLCLCNFVGGPFDPPLIANALNQRYPLCDIGSPSKSPNSSPTADIGKLPDGAPAPFSREQTIQHGGSQIHPQVAVAAHTRGSQAHRTYSIWPQAVHIQGPRDHNTVRT
jgi:hypothetical protein